MQGSNHDEERAVIPLCNLVNVVSGEKYRISYSFGKGQSKYVPHDIEYLSK